ncbi:unnamed protein product [Cuscuta epithymum]|uniref:PLAT domain-containing protein n=1 Tax=Cuscuta epithymum TaxID=186058 RepID=A0AAV0D2N4_9ASTE|nr:unnamed protein product [Cuscuta epithymum]
MSIRHFLFSIAFISFLSSSDAGDLSDECVYSLYVQTGTYITAGTDSKVGVTLGDRTGKEVQVPELRRWGLMGRDHDYFEGGNLDIFSGRGPCLRLPVCRLNVTSDGSGHRPGWYCQFIEVTFTGPRKECSQSTFYVDQWLVAGDLTAILDGCGRRDVTSTPLVVRKPIYIGSAASAFQ